MKIFKTNVNKSKVDFTLDNDLFRKKHPQKWQNISLKLVL